MNSLLFEKKQFSYLCSLIKCSPNALKSLLGLMGQQYSEWEEVKIDKNTGKNKTYSDGTLKKRAIRPPKHDLKVIQRSINRNLLSKIELEPNVYGGVKGKSNISNAKCHQGKKYVLTTDLMEFYPGIKADRVYGFFLEMGYSNHIANWLTKLTTFKNELPQGAPTSPLLANLIFKKSDKELVALSKMHSITYTRYVDDLTFSSPLDFETIIAEILDIVRRNGFRVNHRKTYYKGRQNITGIEVRNNHIDVPLKIKLKLQDELEKGIENGPYKLYVERVQATNRLTSLF